MPICKEHGCKSTALKNITYITDPTKTTDENGVRWVDTHNMISDGSETPAEMHKEFRRVNSMYDKNKKYDERKYYHLVINYKNIEGVTPDMVMSDGREYLEHFYPNHLAIMSVHCDNDGYHFHACINSIDMETGYKIDRSKQDIADRKDFVNQVAYERHGIEPFDWRAAVENKKATEMEEHPTGKDENYNYAEQLMHDDGRQSELDGLREKILRTAFSVQSRQEFEERLKQDYGITMPRNTNNTVSFKYKEGAKGTVRGRKLGDYYSAEMIDKIIEYNRTNVQEQDQAPRMRFEDINQIARDKNYILAQSYGLKMPQKEFNEKSEAELRVRVAIAFIKKQTESNYKIENDKISINGVEIKTDERLQKMYDASVAAEICRSKFDCKDINDMEKRSQEFEDKLAGLKVELRKERKIESSLKKQYEQKQALYDAINTVYNGAGTPEDINKAKHLLYRNGIKQEEFKDVKTIDKISREVADAKNRLEEQSEKTKDIFFKTKELQKNIQVIDEAVAGASFAFNPKFYYGNDLNRQISIVREGYTFEEMLKKATEIAEEHNQVVDIINGANGRNVEPGRARKGPEHTR